jgi:soluble lytic murein transglycosylase
VLASLVILAGVFIYMRYAPGPELPLEESPVNYRILICRHARKANLPEVFVHKVVLAESSGRPWVVSKVGAKGLMQIMPDAETDTMKKLKRTERGNLFNPDYNLLIGTTYLRILCDQFDGDAYLVLGAYHMGRTRVSSLRTANPGISGKELVTQFAGPKTRAYCEKILQGHELQLPFTQRRRQRVTTPATQHN